MKQIAKNLAWGAAGAIALAIAVKAAKSANSPAFLKTLAGYIS